jgi:heterotetrameric sarcosine oxidase delta subunit
MALTDEQWKNYLFIQANPKGIFYEQWNHAHGCRRWFNVVRDTQTNIIYGSYRINENPPAIGSSTSETSQ